MSKDGATGAARGIDPVTERLLDAARGEFIAHGVARTALGDIARRAKVSRHTLYRRCGDKDQIVSAVIFRDLVEFFGKAEAAIQALTSFEDKLVEAFVIGMRETRDHPLVTALKNFDGGTFSQRLSETSSPGYLAMVKVVAEMVKGHTETATVHVERSIDLMIRLTATLVISPSPLAPTETDNDARDFARTYLVPLAHAARAQVDKESAHQQN